MQEDGKKKKKSKGGVGCAHLPVRRSVFLDGPAGLVAKGLEDFVVVAVLRELVAAVHAEPRKYLRRDRPPPPLPPLVVLSLPPRR